MRAEDFLPDDLDKAKLSNGATIRKGTIASFLANVKTLTSPEVTKDDKITIQKDIEDALPALKGVGLFDVMEIRDANVRAFVQQKLAEMLPNQ